MKRRSSSTCLSAILIFLWTGASAQSLQLHYDFRHNIDPGRNPANYPTLYFEYYRKFDSGISFFKPGAFLLKSQADFTGSHSNLGKYYMQVSQEFRCWKPLVFINLQYSGGLGVTTPRQYSYYIVNTYSIGISYPFRWGSGYFSSVINLKYVPYAKPSRDFLYTFYFYRGLWNYRGSIEGDFSVWTENKNHGDQQNDALHGKRLYFFAEPQCWYGIKKGLAVGTKINIYYHVNFPENHLEVYPTVAIRYKFRSN